MLLWISSLCLWYARYIQSSVDKLRLSRGMDARTCEVLYSCLISLIFLWIKICGGSSWQLIILDQGLNRSKKSCLPWILLWCCISLMHEMAPLRRPHYLRTNLTWKFISVFITLWMGETFFSWDCLISAQGEFFLLSLFSSQHSSESIPS